MKSEGLNIEDLNAFKTSVTLLNYTVVNTSIEERDTGSISPAGKDIYILNNAILLDPDNVLMADGIPVVYNS